MVTKKTQIHLASPVRSAQNVPRRLADKQTTQRDKDKHNTKTNQQRNPPQKRVLQVQAGTLEARPKDPKGIIKTLNEPTRKQ